MKKLTTISLFIFGVVVTAILVAGLVFYQDNKVNNSGLNISYLNNSIGQSSGQTNDARLTLTAVEIAKHKSPGDCWLIISGKVYNVSSYLSAHPGGAGAITPYCGQEATRVFQTKDKNTPHSSFAASLLANYYIGDLNQIVSQQQIQQNIQKTNTVTPPVGGRSDGERENEDD